MKRIICYLICLLIWGCSSSTEEYRKEFESDFKIDTLEHFLNIDDSLANYLFNDQFFVNLCEQLDVRQFLESKNSKQISDSTIIDYRDLFKRLFILGDSLKIPNILRYRTEYYQIKYSENILTRAGLDEAIVSGTCILGQTWNEMYYESAALFDAAFHIYRQHGGCCELNFSNSVEYYFQYYASGKRDLYNIFQAIVDPFNRSKNCGEYVELLNHFKVATYERNEMLYYVTNEITQIVFFIANTPQAWLPCYKCYNRPDQGGSDSNGSEGNEGINPDPVIDKDSIKYVTNEEDIFFQKKFQKTMSRQLPNTCVTSIMEYVNHIFGGNIKESAYVNYYLRNYNRIVVTDGVLLRDVEEFIRNFFEVSEFIDFPVSIKKGEVIITDIPSDIENSSHCVVVVGIAKDGKLIYMDPEKGYICNMDEADFLMNYAISISGNK